MFKPLLICVIFFFVSFNLSGQFFKPSPNVQISILTGEEGNDLHTLFGHTTIRVYDSEKKIDWFYNFGTFDYDTSNFIWKFTTRTLDYHLSKYEGHIILKYLIQSYKEENRSLYEQVLDLSYYQKVHLINDLEKLYNSEDRFYRYDFFFDNCSTRVRDLLKNSLDDALHLDLVSSHHKVTFRQLLEPYLKDAWINLGISLALGSPAHAEVGDYDAMFLPKRLMEELDEASIRYYGREHNLVKYKRVVYKSKREVYKQSIITPVFVFMGLFLILSLSTYWSYLTHRISIWIDFILFFLSGFIGIILLFLWFGTDHLALPYNYNLLWALPSHLFIAFFFFFKKKPLFLKYYLLFTSILLFFIFITWFIFSQKLHYSLFLIIGMLIMRSCNMYFQWSRINSK